jgi:hypothetical protein
MTNVSVQDCASPALRHSAWVEDIDYHPGRGLKQVASEEAQRLRLAARASQRPNVLITGPTDGKGYYGQQTISVANDYFDSL